MHIARLAVATLAALAIATPASAQFGGLKKKAKATAGQEAVSKAADEAASAPAEGAAPADRGGMIVLTKDVVNQLLAGLKAGQAEREAAAKEDTPFGRYQKAEAAYAVAQPKCEKAQQTFYMRAESNKKLFDKWTAFNDKVIAAQEQRRPEARARSTRIRRWPCRIRAASSRSPSSPRATTRRSATWMPGPRRRRSKASGFSRSELAMVKERAIAILQGATPPGGASATEKSAVSAKSAELKPLLGVNDQPPAQAAKPAPAPAPTPTPRLRSIPRCRPPRRA